MINKVKILNKNNFKETVNSGISVVDFWAEWCGPCKMQKPIIEDLASKVDDRVNICQVDTDQNRELSTEFNVMSIPTIVLFKDGKMLDQKIGLQTLEQLENLIKSAS